MDKATYFKTLGKEIKLLPKSIQKEIINDYTELFQEGLDSGKGEEEISFELGHPTDLVNMYIKRDLGAGGQQDLVVFDNLIGQIVLWISLLIFIPINGWLFQKGYYGEVPKGIENITKLFSLSLIIDPFFITATITALVILFKKIWHNTERMRVFPKKTETIEKMILCIIPFALILIYLFYHGFFRSLLIWMFFTPLVPVLLFKMARKITERTISKTHPMA